MPEEVKRVLDRTHLVELTTQGRKSGLPRPVEISFAHREGQLFLLAFGWSQWVRNLREHPAAEARVGSLHLSVEALFPGDAEAVLTLARQLFTVKYGADYVRSWYEGTRRWPIVLTIRSWAKG
jgi:deazaflavin-dependent oxidoreductase (nitroreductase family)